jgi:hypothetical protein
MSNYYTLRLAKLKEIEHLLDTRVFGKGLISALSNADILELAKTAGTEFYPTVWLLRNSINKEDVQILAKNPLRVVSIETVYEQQLSLSMNEWVGCDAKRLTFCSSTNGSVTCFVTSKSSLRDMFWKIVDCETVYE